MTAGVARRDVSRVAVEGTLDIDATDSTHSAGGVSLAADMARFYSVKIGDDDNDDDDP